MTDTMSSNSKISIIEKLRGAVQPFQDVQKPEQYLEMVPVSEGDTNALWNLFTLEAEKLSSCIHLCDDEHMAQKRLMEIIGDEQSVISWSEENIPFQKIPEAFKRFDKGTNRDHSGVKIGISGALAAIASTGSIILDSGKGRHRITSLLADTHIVLINKSNICSTLEKWLRGQRENGMKKVLNPSNLVIISGPSRTADIAMELILGMHGPKELHVIVF